MRLGYFTMPLHPPHRDPAQTLQEDREAIILADRLGFHDAFVGENLTDRCENVTNSFIFLATLIAETKTIKLATGTSNLSQSHPTVVAAQAAMFDHLAKGRFIFGISPGALSSDAEALGLLAELGHHLLAGDTVGIARIVLDVGRVLQLATPLEALEDERLEVGARGVERRRVAGGTAADDDHVLDLLRLCHIRSESSDVANTLLFIVPPRSIGRPVSSHSWTRLRSWKKAAIPKGIGIQKAIRR